MLLRSRNGHAEGRWNISRKDLKMSPQHCIRRTEVISSHLSRAGPYQCSSKNTAVIINVIPDVLISALKPLRLWNMILLWRASWSRSTTTVILAWHPMHITRNLNGLAEDCLLQSQWVVKKNSASVHLHAKLSLQGTRLRNYESSGFGLSF